jgi:hypothetical protein
MACEAPSFDLDHSLSQLAGQLANTQGRVENKRKEKKENSAQAHLETNQGTGGGRNNAYRSTDGIQDHQVSSTF